MKDIAIAHMADRQAEEYIKAVAQGHTENKWKVILTGEYVPKALAETAQKLGIHIEKIGYPVENLASADTILGYFKKVFQKVALAEAEGKNVLFCCTAGRHFSPSIAQICEFARGKEKLKEETLAPLTEMYLEMITGAVFVKYGKKVGPGALYKEISLMWNAQKEAAIREKHRIETRHGRILRIKHPNLKMPFPPETIPANVKPTTRETHANKLVKFLNRLRRK